MDFWGFEGRYRHELPGDGFGLFQGPSGTTGATPPAPQAPTTPTAPAAPTPPNWVNKSPPSGPRPVEAVKSDRESNPRYYLGVMKNNKEIGFLNHGREGKPYGDYWALEGQNHVFKGRWDQASGEWWKPKPGGDNQTYVRANKSELVDSWINDVEATSGFPPKTESSGAPAASEDPVEAARKGLGAPELSAEDKANEKIWKELGLEGAYSSSSKDALLEELGRRKGVFEEALKDEKNPAKQNNLKSNLERIEQLRTQVEGGGGGGTGATTQSAQFQDPFGAVPFSHARASTQQLGGLIGDAAGVAGSVAAAGYAGRAVSQAFGGSGTQGGGGVGFGYSSPYGGVSVGPDGAGVGGGGMMMGGVGDLTGTGFGIGFSGGSYRETARKLDAMLQQLMMAIMMGNFDAISSAIVLLTMKAKTTMIHASLQVIQQMRQYDNQMKTISDAMGKLDSKDSGYSGNLARLNADMQTSSMGRQGIANTLRDIAGMNEEMSNFEKSFLDMKSRTQANYARWT